jgi:ubiquinone/menaquinone biosynthesis C-methylase UbiE
MNNKKQVVGNSYYNKTAKNYIKIRKESKEWQSEQKIVEELINQLPDGINVLDIPFGTGRFVDFYLNKKMNIYGLEISEAMIGAAKEALEDSFNKCEIRIGDATEKLPYDDNFFDLVVCLRFLKFFPYNTAKEIITEIYRVTKSRVIILINVYKEKNPEETHSEEYLQSLENIGGNVFEKDLIKMFNEVGFHIEKNIKVEFDAQFKGRSNIIKKTLSNFKKIKKHIRNRTFFSTLIRKLNKSKENKSIKVLETKILLLKV